VYMLIVKRYWASLNASTCSMMMMMMIKNFWPLSMGEDRHSNWGVGQVTWRWRHFAPQSHLTERHITASWRCWLVGRVRQLWLNGGASYAYTIEDEQETLLQKSVIPFSTPRLRMTPNLWLLELTCRLRNELRYEVQIWHAARGRTSE